MKVSVEALVIAFAMLTGLNAQVEVPQSYNAYCCFSFNFYSIIKGGGGRN